MKKLLVVTTSMFGFLAMQGLPVRADDALEALIKHPSNGHRPPAMTPIRVFPL